MRFEGLVVVVVAGCYSPSPPANAPCSGVEKRCPSEQMCVNNVCVGDGMMPPDVPPNLVDTDGDTIDDTVDNCVSVANKGQHNEDGDARGDACDGWPPIANDMFVDGDNDGVDDTCDPNPAVPGDRIVLFEGLRDGVPDAWPKTGVWTLVPGGGAVVATPQSGELVSMRPVGVAPDRTFASFALITPLAQPGGPGGMGIVAPATSDGTGLTCLLFYPLANPDEQRAGIVESPSLAIRSSQAFAWTAGTPHLVIESRTGDAYSCAIASTAMTHTSAAMENGLPNPSVMSVFTRSLAMRVDWVMHIDSP